MTKKVYRKAHPHISTEVDIGFAVPTTVALSKVLAFLEKYNSSCPIEIKEFKTLSKYHDFTSIGRCIKGEMTPDEAYIFAKKLEDKFGAIIEFIWFHINYIDKY